MSPFCSPQRMKILKPEAKEGPHSFLLPPPFHKWMSTDQLSCLYGREAQRREGMTRDRSLSVKSSHLICLWICLPSQCVSSITIWTDCGVHLCLPRAYRRPRNSDITEGRMQGACPSSPHVLVFHHPKRTPLALCTLTHTEIGYTFFSQGLEGVPFLSCKINNT